jgi:putative membrane protein
MTSKRMCSKVLLGFVPTLLAGAMAVAQNQPGGGSAGTSNNQSTTNPSTSAPGPGGMASDMNDNQQLQGMADQSFVKKALEGNAAEVQLGQLAQQKSQSDDVKQFAQKMVSDHTQLNDQMMKPIAQQLKVKEPTELSKKDRELVAKLGGLSGQEFDQAYIQAMVRDHKQDLSEFKDEASTTQNPGMKQAAQQGAALISQHLQMIEQIAQNHNMPDGKVMKSSSGS